MRIKKKTANLSEYKVGNNAIIANSVCLGKPRLFDRTEISTSYGLDFKTCVKENWIWKSQREYEQSKLIMTISTIFMAYSAIHKTPAP